MRSIRASVSVLVALVAVLVGLVPAFAAPRPHREVARAPVAPVREQVAA